MSLFFVLVEAAIDTTYTSFSNSSKLLLKSVLEIPGRRKHQDSGTCLPKAYSNTMCVPCHGLHLQQQSWPKKNILRLDIFSSVWDYWK